MVALTEVKKGIEAMLQEHTKSYEDKWKAKGRDPPTEDEWYEIVEGEVGDNGNAEIIELVREAVKGSESPSLNKTVSSF